MTVDRLNAELMRVRARWNALLDETSANMTADLLSYVRVTSSGVNNASLKIQSLFERDAAAVEDVAREMDYAWANYAASFRTNWESINDDVWREIERNRDDLLRVERERLLERFYENETRLKWTSAVRLLREADEARTRRDKCAATIALMRTEALAILRQRSSNAQIRDYMHRCETLVNEKRDLFRDCVTYSIANATNAAKCYETLERCREENERLHFARDQKILELRHKTMDVEIAGRRVRNLEKMMTLCYERVDRHDYLDVVGESLRREADLRLKFDALTEIYNKVSFVNGRLQSELDE